MDVLPFEYLIAPFGIYGKNIVEYPVAGTKVGVRCKRVRYKPETVATYIPPITNTRNTECLSSEVPLASEIYIVAQLML
jgi:hypothetical protein